MDPSSVQAFGQFNAQADLNTQVSNLAPLATTYHGVAPGAPAQFAAPTSTTSQGVLPAFWGKVESIGSETANIAGDAASFVGHTAVDAAEAPYKLGEGIGKGIMDRVNEGGIFGMWRSSSLNAQSEQLSDKLDSLVNAYRTNQINAKEYSDGMKEFTQESTNLQHDLTSFQSQVGSDQINTVKAAVGTASDIVTIMTLGAASPAILAENRAAAATLESASELSQGAAMITKLANSEEDFAKFAPLSQQVLKIATTQALQAAGKQATAGQISRAVATNLLLKYPLTYNALDSTGLQVYKELDNNQYGDAVKTIAFNAALLFSGGPIGWGLKNATRLAKATSVAAGLRPGSILDELSSRIGNGDRRALAGIAQNLVKNGNESEVKNMVVALESNLARAGGNPSQAVNLIVDHLENYVSWGSLKNATHQEVWDNITNYFKHAEGLQQLKESGQIEGVASDDSRAVVPGRFATEDKNNIATAVTKNDLPIKAESDATTAKAATPEADTSGSLPKALQGAKPNYNYGSNHFALTFQNDTAKALYVVAQSTASARDADYMTFLRTQLPGKTDAEIRAMGQTVKDNIKAEAKGSTASSIHVESPVSSASPEAQSYSKTFGVPEAQAQTELTANSAPAEPASTMPETPTVESRMKAYQALKAANPNAAWANNVNVDKQITHLIQTIKDPEELHKAINKIPTQLGLKGVPKDYAKQMAKDGYIAIVPDTHNLPVTPFSETSGKLVTSGAEGDFFTKAATPVPVLRSAAAALTWAGLSPEVASQRVGEVFNSSFADNLPKAGYTIRQGDTKVDAANDILQKLSNYMKAPTGGMKVFGKVLPISDMRQLSTPDVMRALNVSQEEAKNVQNAIMQAHLDVPRQIAGLGTKIMDRNFKYNPLAAPYSRIQGAARFAWNPVFTQGRLPIKAEILAQMQTGGKFPTIAGTNTFMKMFFPGQYREIDAIANDSAFKKLMPGGFGGEASDSTGFTDTGSKFGINTLRPVAGVIRDMANNMGIDAKTLVEQYPEKVSDAAAALLHYDHNASFLNSPMARTLNMAIFPFRFNVKVAGFMAKFLAKQEPAIQYAAVKGIMNANSYLKSPQGQAWYSQNADAIGLFGYFSPLETISVISNALGLKHDSVSQYGELGGLPFGVIPQILDSAGLTHFNQAYVNPKTGAISQNYVPKSAYGAANAAIADLLGALYTFPGATAGLTSKGTIDRTVAGGILPGSSKDFNKVAPTNVTPEQQQFANTVQSLNGSTPNTPSAKTVAPLQPGVNVPAQSSPLTTPNPNKSFSTSTKAKKKADFTPALLPGQTALGQL